VERGELNLRICIKKMMSRAEWYASTEHFNTGWTYEEYLQKFTVADDSNKELKKLLKNLNKSWR